MQEFKDLLRQVWEQGQDVPDRTGTGTRELFATRLEVNCADGWFPLLTMKRTHFFPILIEALWLLKGEDNVSFMTEHGVKHWLPWAKDDGWLGRVYGVQWRHWRAPGEEGSEWDVGYVDQIAELVKGLKENPHSRRHMVTAWNPGELDQMALPPCHYGFQCHVDADGFLSMQVTQRSADLLIGVPYDVAMYAVILRMLAQACGLKADRLVFVFGSTHIYQNHFHVVEELLARKPRTLPTLRIKNRNQGIDDFKPEDFEIWGYHPHPFIKLPVAV